MYAPLRAGKLLGQGVLCPCRNGNGIFTCRQHKRSGSATLPRWDVWLTIETQRNQDDLKILRVKPEAPGPAPEIGGSPRVIKHFFMIGAFCPEWGRVWLESDLLRKSVGRPLRR
jgi:hypothetical protein